MLTIQEFLKLLLKCYQHRNETSVETMPASVFLKDLREWADKKPEFTAAMSGYANGSGEPYIH